MNNQHDDAPAGKPATEPTQHFDGSRYTLAATLIIAVAAGAALARIAVTLPLQSANDRSRWSTVYALVHHGTYAIDRVDSSPRWQTIDKVRYEDHFYSSKPPLLATVVAGVYWAVRAVTGLDLGSDTATTTRVLLLLVNWLPAVLSWGLGAFVLRRLTTDTVSALVVLAIAAFATLNGPFLATLNNHSVGIAAFWAMLAACVAFETTAWKSTSAAAAGFFAAWGICNELPAFPLGIVLFAWFVKRDAKRACFAFAPAAAIPLIAFFATNWIVTGGLKPFYLSYGTETYEYVYRGIPSYWLNPSGIDSNSDSTPVYIFHTLLGHHGIFSLTPVFLLLLWAFAMRRDQRPLAASDLRNWSAWRWTTLAMTVWTLLFFWSKTENYNYGGSSSALRWTLWLTPFWLVVMLPAVSRMLTSGGRVLAIAVLVGLSTFFAWEPFATPWTQPWLYRQMTDLGWIDYSTPVPPLPRETYTWLKQLPEGEQQDDYSVTFYVDGLDARAVRMTDAGLTSDGLRAITVRQPGSTEEWVVEPAGFDAGKKVTEWATEDVEELRGLPASRPYRAGRPDYLFTPLQEDALSTQKLAARVYDNKRKAWVRRDVWWCDRIPYGVAQQVITISARDGTILSRETWRVAKVGKLLPESEVDVATESED